MVDIEAVIIDWLNSLGISAHSEVPARRSKEFVTVERIGGNRDNVAIDRPRIDILCWSDSRANAASLARRVDNLLPQLAQNNRISRVSRNSLHNAPDFESGQARYGIVVDLVVIN